ncbi:MAG: glycosyltransferase family 4 protein [Candidatus Saccharibacteria bacterium]|nr:glycosyltransferase family 4 protein [Candidatus Saccharibacteria bacterium]
MKIGFVLDDTLDSTDGVQQYVLGLGRQLGKHGHEVHYLVGQSERTDIPHIHSLGRNVKVSFNKNRLSMPVLAPPRRIKRLLTREKFDILHIQMPYSPSLGGRVLSRAKKLGIPTVGTFHILPASSLEKRGLKLLAAAQKPTLRSMSRVIAVSEPARQCFEDIFNIKAKVIPNPVDVSRYKPLKNTPKQKRIVFVGRLVERKGCHKLLEALAWMHDRDFLRDTKVTICGDGPLKKQLWRFVNSHHLEDIVTFAGRVKEDEKIRHLQTATIAVFPSTGGESFGIVLIEAMAAGSEVVIAGDNPGYRFVMDGREQHLIDPSDKKTFSALLIHYLTTPKDRQKSRQWQQKRVRDFTLPKVTRSIERIYQEVIAKHDKD